MGQGTAENSLEGKKTGLQKTYTFDSRDPIQKNSIYNIFVRSLKHWYNSTIAMIANCFIVRKPLIIIIGVVRYIINLLRNSCSAVSHFQLSLSISVMLWFGEKGSYATQ